MYLGKQGEKAVATILFISIEELHDIIRDFTDFLIM